MEQKQSLSWKEKFIAPAILASITAFVYSFSLNYAFQFDDTYNIRSHFDIRINTFSRMAFKQLRWISYWLNGEAHKLGQKYFLDGFNPFYYRTFNIFFHVTAGLLLFQIVLKAFSGLKEESFYKKNAFPLAFITALLFLLHPVQTQTVSYVIQGQLEGVAFLCMMLITFLFLHITSAKSFLQKTLLTVLLFVTGIFGCGSKEILILAPIMLLLVDWFFVAQGEWKSFKSRLLLHAAFLFVITGTYTYYLKPSFFKRVAIGQTTVVNNIGNVITKNPETAITPWLYLISQFKVIFHYIGIFLWPFNMSADYDWQVIETIASPHVFLPFFILLLLAAFIFMRLRKNKTDVIAFSFLWFFIGLAPRSTIIPSTELLADYKTYFSSFGILLLLGIGLFKLFEWIKNKIAQTECPSLVHHPYTALCILAVLLGASTYQRNLVWKTPEAFWRDVLVHSPFKARAHNNYGTAVAVLGRHDEALIHFKRATVLDKFYPDPWNNLAVTYEKLGNPDLGIQTMQEALKIHKDYPEFYSNMGAFYVTKKEYEKVEPWCKIAIKQRPHYGKAYYNWARAKYEMGNYEEAWDLFYTAVYKADYDLELGFEGLAVASMKIEKYDEAIKAFKRVADMHPESNHAQFNLGNAYYCNGNIEKAEHCYQNMLKIYPDDHRAFYNLGELYLKTKGPQEALSYFEKAQPLAAYVPRVKERYEECKKLLAEKA